jgi:hypothetical protein
MEQPFNIVNLIENNPIKCLNIENQCKFINKIKENFNKTEQNLFIASFYTYLNYDQNNDFIINLNDIWKWLGFSRKDHCKVVLEKHFEKNSDYIINTKEKTASMHAEADKNEENRGGHNKEIILMNIKTFKKLCLKSCTKKADEIHNYFIKLENILHETINEEAKELKEQLKLKDKELEDKNNEILLKTQKILLQSYHLKNVVYLIHIEEDIYKFGFTHDIKERFNTHKSNFNNNIKLIFCIESIDNKFLESNFKKYLATTNFAIELYYKQKKNIELIKITNDDIVISNKTKKEIRGIEIIKDKLIELNSDLKESKVLINELEKKLKEKEELLKMYQSSNNNINNNEYKNNLIKKTEEYNYKENKFLETIKSLDAEIIALNNEILTYKKNIIELEAQNKYLNERYSDYDNLKEEIKKQKQIINDYEKRYNTISTHIVSIDKGKEILDNVNKIFIKKENIDNNKSQDTKKTYIRKPFVLPKIDFDDSLFISINENEKKEFKEEYLLDILEQNNKNKVLLNDLIKYLEARYKYIYNTREFKLKLITYIKNNFEDIKTPECHISSDDKRLRFKTDFYIENVSFKGYSSLFSENIYSNFIEEYLEKKTYEKIKMRGGNEAYKYFVFADDLYNKFNEYLEQNNIKYSFYESKPKACLDSCATHTHNKDCRIIDIFKDDLQKYICKLTGCLKNSTTRDKREFVIFTSIIFKDNN